MKQKPLSLAPLKFNEAVADLLKVKPEPKPQGKKARPNRQPNKRRK